MFKTRHHNVDIQCPQDHPSEREAEFEWLETIISDREGMKLNLQDDLRQRMVVLFGWHFTVFPINFHALRVAISWILWSRYQHVL